MLTTSGAWLQHWIHFGDRGAALLQRTGPETIVSYACTAEEGDCEIRLI